MYTALRLVPILVAITALSQPVWSADARSIALGGSAIANAQGVHGALENPASMMAMKRAGERTHLRLGYSFNIQSPGSALDALTDDANSNLINDIEDQINALNNQELLCDSRFSNGDDVCVTDTQTLSDLANRLLNIANDLGNDTIAVQGSADVGMAFTQNKYPIAISLIPMVTIIGTPTIAESDKDYIREFATLLDNNSLTLDEIRNSTYLEADALGNPLGVQQPEDVLLSEGRISALLRVQLALSMASEMQIGDIMFDTGITAKLSRLAASSTFSQAASEFAGTEETFETRLESNEVQGSSFTFDLGASVDLSGAPITVSTVIRNVIPESISTDDGFEFQTTPQFIVGAAYQVENLSFTGDLALNKAKQDNFESQKIGIGAELTKNILAFRAGISHDTARSDKATAVTLGLGLGPLQLGSRVSSINNIEASVQLSHSF